MQLPLFLQQRLSQRQILAVCARIKKSKPKDAAFCLLGQEEEALRTLSRSIEKGWAIPYPEPLMNQHVDCPRIARALLEQGAVPNQKTVESIVELCQTGMRAVADRRGAAPETVEDYFRDFVLACAQAAPGLQWHALIIPPAERGEIYPAMPASLMIERAVPGFEEELAKACLNQEVSNTNTMTKRERTNILLGLVQSPAQTWRADAEICERMLNEGADGSAAGIIGCAVDRFTPGLLEALLNNGVRPSRTELSQIATILHIAGRWDPGTNEWEEPMAKCMLLLRERCPNEWMNTPLQTQEGTYTLEAIAEQHAPRLSAQYLNQQLEQNTPQARAQSRRASRL